MIKYLENQDNYNNLYRDDYIDNYDLCYFGNYDYWKSFSPNSLIDENSDDTFKVSSSEYYSELGAWCLFNHLNNYILNLGKLQNSETCFLSFSFLQKQCLQAVRFKCNNFSYGFQVLLYGSYDNSDWIKLDTCNVGLTENININNTYYCNNESGSGNYFISNNFLIIKFQNNKFFNYYKIVFKNITYYQYYFKISTMSLYNIYGLKFPVYNYTFNGNILCYQGLYNGYSQNVTLQQNYALFGNNKSSSYTISPYFLYNFKDFSLSFCANLFGDNLSGTILSKSDNIFNLSVNLEKRFHPNDLNKGMVFYAKLDESYNTYIQPENKGIPTDSLVFYDVFRSYNVAAITQQFLYYSGSIHYLTQGEVPCVQFSTNKSYINSYLNFNSCSNFSLSMWVYVSDIAGKDIDDIAKILYIGQEKQDSDYALQIIYKEQKFYAYVKDGENNSFCLIAQDARNQWMNFCVIVQDNIIKSYLNGIFTSSVSLKNNFSLSDSSILYINNGMKENGFDGIKVSSIRIYSKAITYLQCIYLVSEFMQISTQLNQKKFISLSQTNQELQCNNVSFDIKDDISCAYFKNKNSLIKSYIKFSDENFPKQNQNFTLSFCCCFPNGKNDLWNSIFSYGSNYRKIVFNEDNNLKIAENNNREINFDVNVPDKMTHFLIMKNGNNYLCYVNNLLMGTYNYNYCNIILNGLGLIGAFGTDFNQLCEDCYIAQIRLYNRVLSDQQRNWLYEQFNNKYDESYYSWYQEDGKYNCVFMIKTNLQTYEFQIPYENINNKWNNYVFTCDYYYYHFYINNEQVFKTKNIKYIFESDYQYYFNIGCKTLSQNMQGDFIINMKFKNFCVYDYAIGKRQIGYFQKNYL